MVLALPTAEHFYLVQAQTVYPVLRDCSVNADLVTVRQRLQDAHKLKDAGGSKWLSDCIDSVPSVEQLPVWLETVKTKYLLRRLLQTTADLSAKVYQSNGDCADLLDEAERAILAIRPQQGGSGDIRTLVDEAVQKIEGLYQRQGSISGLPTGLTDLDLLTDGLHPGEMVVIAALPSVGKTALAMNIAIHNALAGLAVGVCSSEMRPTHLVVRAITSQSRTDLYDVRRGCITPAGFDGMARTAASIASTRLHIENSSGFSIGQIVALARRMKQRHDIKLLVVDYLQLLHFKADNREQEVSGISKGVKAIAMQLDIPVLALSQLNDSGQLRESRAIGQDADSVWRLEQIGDKKPDVQEVKLTVDKNREGPTGYVDLMFLKKFTRFECKQKCAVAPPPYHDD